MNDREYIEGRLEDQINWYDRASAKHKRRYTFFKVTEITFAASIPVVLAISELVGSSGNAP